MPGSNAVDQPRLRRIAMVIDLAAKLGLVILIGIAIVHPDLGNVRGKASGVRDIAYPLGALVVPAVWWFCWRRRSYPWLGDALVTLPWFTDTLGNRLNLFDTIDSFDDWMHLVNWALLTAGVLILTLRQSATLRETMERALAFGVTAALGWEIAEYFAFIRHSPELATAYTDTLGDLSLGSLGAILSGIVMYALWNRGKVNTSPNLCA